MYNFPMFKFEPKERPHNMQPAYLYFLHELTGDLSNQSLNSQDNKYNF